MTDPRDPPRWLEALGSDDPLRMTLEAGREELPSQDALDRVFARLPPVPDPGGGGEPGDGGSGADGGSPDGAVTDGGGAEGFDPGALDGGSLDAASGLADAASSAASGASAASGTAAAGKALLGGGAGASIAPAAATGLSALKVAGAITAIGVASAVGYAAYPDDASTDIPAPSDSSTLVLPAELRPPSPSDVPLPEQPEPGSEDPAAHDDEDAPASSGAEAAAGSLPPPKAPSEIELLQQAQQALASNPGKALELVDLAAATYPGGALSQERQLLRIQALTALGRRDEALALARAFRDAHPDSAFVRRLEVLFPELAQAP